MWVPHHKNAGTQLWMRPPSHICVKGQDGKKWKVQTFKDTPCEYCQYCEGSRKVSKQSKVDIWIVNISASPFKPQSKGLQLLQIFICYTSCQLTYLIQLDQHILVWAKAKEVLDLGLDHFWKVLALQFVYITVTNHKYNSPRSAELFHDNTQFRGIQV